MKDQYILRGSLPYLMTIYLIRTQSLRIYFGIEKGLAIICPAAPSISVFYLGRKNLPCFQVLDKKRIHSSATDIHRKRCPLVIRAYGIFSKLIKLVSFRHLIDIKEHFFSCSFFVPLAQVNRIFLPLFKTRKVPITIVLVGYRLVIFFDTSLHLLKKSLF